MSRGDRFARRPARSEQRDRLAARSLGEAATPKARRRTRARRCRSPRSDDVRAVDRARRSGSTLAGRPRRSTQADAARSARRRQCARSAEMKRPIGRSVQGDRRCSRGDPARRRASRRACSSEAVRHRTDPRAITKRDDHVVVVGAARRRDVAPIGPRRQRESVADAAQRISEPGARSCRAAGCDVDDRVRHRSSGASELASSRRAALHEKRRSAPGRPSRRSARFRRRPSSRPTARG